MSYNVTHMVDALKSMGFSELEARVYVAALSLGKASPSNLAQKSGVKRPTLYKFLPVLKARGLLKEEVSGRRRLLVAEDPQLILDTKRSEMELLEKTIPELRALFGSVSLRPKLTSFDGSEGLKHLYMEVLRVKKPILEFVSLENISPEMEEYSKNYFIPQRVNRGIPIRILISGPTKSQLLEIITKDFLLREVRVLEKKHYPIPLDCYITGTLTAFILYRSDSEPVGILIDSAEIATTMASLFEIGWVAGHAVNSSS